MIKWRIRSKYAGKQFRRKATNQSDIYLWKNSVKHLEEKREAVPPDVAETPFGKILARMDSTLIEWKTKYDDRLERLEALEVYTIGY